jgi:hypothetical protein
MVQSFIALLEYLYMDGGEKKKKWTTCIWCIHHLNVMIDVHDFDPKIRMGLIGLIIVMH